MWTLDFNLQMILFKRAVTQTHLGFKDGCSTQGSVHLVHLPHVPDPSCSSSWWEGSLVLVHCLHPAVAVWLYPPYLPCLLDDQSLPHQSEPVSEDNSPQALVHLPRGAAAGCPDHALHQAREEHARPLTCLCNDSHLDHSLCFHSWCISVTVWKVITRLGYDNLSCI